MRSPLLATAIIIGVMGFTTAIPKTFERAAVREHVSGHSSQAAQEVDHFKTRAPVGFDLLPLRPV
jgi:hypothetical protein